MKKISLILCFSIFQFLSIAQTIYTDGAYITTDSITYEVSVWHDFYFKLINIENKLYNQDLKDLNGQPVSPFEYAGGEMDMLSFKKACTETFTPEELYDLKEKRTLIRLYLTKSNQGKLLEVVFHVYHYRNPSALNIPPEKFALFENESIYYNVDRIHHAIQENVSITFTYLEWNIKKELQPRRKGKAYRVSPWALTWQDENYYLIAYDDIEEKIKHFRVDKMNRITELTDEKRKGMEAFKEFDIAEYTNRTFGMFGGEPATVTLRLPAHMVGIVIDRFGRDTDIRMLDEETISARVKAAVSGQFFGWVTGLGDGIELLGPDSVRAEYKKYLQNLIQKYE